MTTGTEFELNNSITDDNSVKQVGSKHRGRLDVVADIIQTCDGGANKSKIKLEANLNTQAATQLVEKLVSSNLLTASKEDGRIIYKSTEDGNRFLHGYLRTVEMLDFDWAVRIRRRFVKKTFGW